MENRAELLCIKLALLQTVLEETEKQRGFIADGNVDGLCASLDARKAAMDAIDELDQAISSLPDAPAGAVAVEIRAVLEQVMGLDAENRRNAAGMAGNLMSSSREVGAGRSIMAYGMPADKSSKFVDREG